MTAVTPDGLPTRMSARMLGRELRTSDRDVNRMLLELGLLDGRPSAYRLTDQGVQAGGSETDYNNGHGGRARRDWSVRTWDSKILNTLRDHMTNRPAPARASDNLALVAGSSSVTTANADTHIAPDGVSARVKVMIGVGVAAVVAVGVVAYPRVKDWWRGMRSNQAAHDGSDTNSPAQ